MARILPVFADSSLRCRLEARCVVSASGTALVRFRASYAKYRLRRDGKTWRNRTVDSEFSDIEDARSARSAAHSRENDGVAPLMRCPPSNLHPRLLPASRFAYPSVDRELHCDAPCLTPQSLDELSEPDWIGHPAGHARDNIQVPVPDLAEDANSPTFPFAFPSPSSAMTTRRRGHCTVAYLVLATVDLHSAPTPRRCCVSLEEAQRCFSVERRSQQGFEHQKLYQ